MTRAARAQRIWENGQRLIDRKWFSLASDPPVKPGNDGSVHFAHRIPGSLRTIQFVRVVPMTPDGVEAPFFKCGLVPVAIPGDDRPPSPALAARSDGKTIQVEVTAGGLNLDLLNRLQPSGQAVPEFRSRRARGTVADALYLPVVASGTLTTVPGEFGAFTVQQPDPSTGTLPPFVRHTWVAEIRYPAEIAVTPGTAPVATPVGADWAVAGPGTPQPSGWSAPSAPVSTMLTVPVPLFTATSAKAAEGSVRLSVTGLPVAHPQAVGPWRLRIWRRSADGVVEPLVPGDPAVAATPDPGPQLGTADSWAVTEPELSLSDPAANTVGFLLVLIDPLGRAGPLTDCGTV